MSEALILYATLAAYAYCYTAVAWDTQPSPWEVRA